MYTINSKILIFILFVYIINIYNINAKVHKHALAKINITSINLKEKIIKRNIYIEKNHKIYEKNFLKNKKIEKIITEAKTYIGTPYKYGGNSRMGIDCSSFISRIFKIYNIKLPPISYKQAKRGLPISKNKLKKGDLLFFSTNFMKKTRINHVGIVIDRKENNIIFIHASSSNGVIISRIKDPYWNHKFIYARRIT